MTKQRLSSFIKRMNSFLLLEAFWLHKSAESEKFSPDQYVFQSKKNRRTFES